MSLVVSNGIKSTGKIVYFTSLFPYVVIFILIGRGCSLPGATDGLLFYLRPDFSKMADRQVWFAASNQLVLKNIFLTFLTCSFFHFFQFFSLSCSWGGMVTLASYNKFHNNGKNPMTTIKFHNQS